jgi:hypothetical protein
MVTVPNHLLQESHGRKLLLVRHPVSGAVFCTDPHCWHMGGELLGGDIEELGQNLCLVCPVHRYKVGGVRISAPFTNNHHSMPTLLNLTTSPPTCRSTLAVGTAWTPT